MFAPWGISIAEHFFQDSFWIVDPLPEKHRELAKGDDSGEVSARAGGDEELSPDETGLTIRGLWPDSERADGSNGLAGRCQVGRLGIELRARGGEDARHCRRAPCRGILR